jgi:hypothetical protein
MCSLPSHTTKQPYSTWPSVGKGSPGRKAEPLDLASTPIDAQYAMKLPLHKSTLSSLRAPATKDDRRTPPGPAASSPRSCKSFIAGWPKCTVPDRASQAQLSRKTLLAQKNSRLMQASWAYTMSQLTKAGFREAQCKQLHLPNNSTEVCGRTNSLKTESHESCQRLQIQTAFVNPNIELNI